MKLNLSNYKICLSICLIIAITLPGCNNDECLKNLRIEELKVLNKDFEIVSEKFDATELTLISNLISQGSINDSLDNNDWDYKLDAISSCHSGRWLLNTKDGYLVKLNYQLTPKIKIHNMDSLATILNIPIR